MNTKKYIPFVLFLVLLVMLALSPRLPVSSAETTGTQIVECCVMVYVADTDPKGVNVRSGPGSSYPVVATRAYHEDIYISGAVGKWMRVTQPTWVSGRDYWRDHIGWVYGPLLAISTATYRNPSPDPSGLVPIYGEPSFEYAIEAWAPQYTEFRIIGCEAE